MKEHFGVSGIKIYAPPFRVKLEDWCGWTGNTWGKVQSVVGSSFRVRGPHESIYTMAANAVLRLIIDYDVDPAQVGFLGFGTESSTDNAAGAIVIKGMVDRALEALGHPMLSRHCEVPEFKHACLGGVYAQKGALRYLATDGRGRQAIVVCGDIAEYERGSSGEQTQGAGAVAMLLSERPVLYRVDLERTGSAADYRGPDFRKPHQRHFMNGAPPNNPARLRDFPVFSGKYSTICYVDEVLRAMDDLLAKLRITPRRFYHQVAGIFMHRPYHAMPVTGAAALYVWGLGASEAHHPELRELCAKAGADFDAALREMRSLPDLFMSFQQGKGTGEDVYPESMKVVKEFRATAKFREVVRSKLALGAAAMMDIGNLYTASLPAWIAAGLEEALGAGRELAEQEFLTVGYGSGDAAEAALIQIAPGWQEAARKIGFGDALARPVDLTRAQYEALHDGHEAPALGYEPRREFVVERLGQLRGGEQQDLGLEYYRYVP